MKDIPPTSPGFWRRAIRAFNARITIFPQTAPGIWQRAIATVLFAVPSALVLVWLIQTSWLQFAWLLAGLFLALSSVFFAAVWRHGFGWFFSRRQWRFHATWVASLLTLVVLFYTEESWRGKRAWASVQREAAARGESSEIAPLTPPAVPDDQNFAKAPGVAELLGLTNPPDSGWPNSAWPFYESLERRWPSASWLLQQSTDLARWQKYFRDHAEKPATADRRGYALTFPATPEPQTPAADVLFALGKFATNLATLRAASQRPVMRLPVDYDKGYFLMEDFANPLESFGSAAHLLSLRASAELAQEQSEAALQDVLLALRLAELVGEEPSEDSFGFVQHTRRSMMQFCVQPIWEGLAAHRWNDGQLAALQKKLAQVDLLAEYPRVMHGETLALMSLFEQVLAFIEGRPSELTRRMTPADSDARFWSWVARTFYPVGWLYQDKAWAYRFYQRHANPLIAEGLRNESFKAEDRTITDPIMVTIMLPKLKEVFTDGSGGSLMLQTFVEQATTACALERFRLAQGQYPDSLEALAPKYLQQVPADVFVTPAAPLKYLRAPDGGFKLYSVGFNRVDDGGKANPSFDPRGYVLSQLSEGNFDLVWVQPGQH